MGESERITVLFRRRGIREKERQRGEFDSRTRSALYVHNEKFEWKNWL